MFPKEVPGTESKVLHQVGQAGVRNITDMKDNWSKLQKATDFSYTYTAVYWSSHHTKVPSTIGVEDRSLVTTAEHNRVQTNLLLLKIFFSFTFTC